MTLSLSLLHFGAYLLLAGLPALALAITLFNLVFWPRGRAGGRLDEVDGNEQRVSVLIPARDEAATIEACVRAVFANDHPIHEVVVYEDRSSDGTREILERLTEEFPKLRIVDGRPLPDGWVGKPHACHRLAEAAEGDVLVYVDADTRLSADGLGRLASLLEGGGFGGRVDLVSAVPRQETGGFFERLVLPMLHLTYTSWLPMPLVWRTHDPRFLAANGQVMAMRREALEAAGGFEAVRNDVVDDMALARRFKRARRRVIFADGHHIARCRMYESAGEVWEGFSKNLYEGIGGSPVALFAVVGLYSTAFVLPYLALIAGWLSGSTFWLGPAAVGVAANVVLRGGLAWRFRQAVEGILLQPVAALALMAIAVNSFLWNARGTIRWAGRTYASRDNR